MFDLAPEINRKSGKECGQGLPENLGSLGLGG